MKKTFLLDVNVWMALSFDDHDHHGAAFALKPTLGDYRFAPIIPCLSCDLEILPYFLIQISGSIVLWVRFGSGRFTIG